MINPSKTAIVTVNYNGWRDTLRCLESILQLNTRAFEVVVIDNGSHDGSVKQLTAWLSSRPDVDLFMWDATSIPEELAKSVKPTDSRTSVTLINSSCNLGFSGGNNLGIRYAELRDACYVWLLNNDTTVAPDSLSSLQCAAAEYGNRVLLSSKILGMHEKSGDIWFEGAVYNPWIAEARHVDHEHFGRKRNRYLAGCALFIPMQVVTDIGRLDDRLFLYAEDLDYCIRAAKAGIPMRVIDKSGVAHLGTAGSTVASSTAYRRYVMNMITVVCRHHGVWRLIAIVPYHLLKAIMLLAFRRRSPEAIHGYLRGLTEGVRNCFRERFIPASR